MSITAAHGGGGLIATAAASNGAAGLRAAGGGAALRQPVAPFLALYIIYHYDAQGNAGRGPVPEAR